MRCYCYYVWCTVLSRQRHLVAKLENLPPACPGLAVKTRPQFPRAFGRVTVLQLHTGWVVDAIGGSKHAYRVGVNLALHVDHHPPANTLWR